MFKLNRDFHSPCWGLVLDKYFLRGPLKIQLKNSATKDR